MGGVKKTKTGTARGALDGRSLPAAGEVENGRPKVRATPGHRPPLGVGIGGFFGTKKKEPEESQKFHMGKSSSYDLKKRRITKPGFLAEKREKGRTEKASQVRSRGNLPGDTCKWR